MMTSLWIFDEELLSNPRKRNVFVLHLRERRIFLRLNQVLPEKSDRFWIMIRALSSNIEHRYDFVLTEDKEEKREIRNFVVPLRERFSMFDSLQQQRSFYTIDSLFP